MLNPGGIGPDRPMLVSSSPPQMAPLSIQNSSRAGSSGLLSHQDGPMSGSHQIQPERYRHGATTTQDDANISIAASISADENDANGDGCSAMRSEEHTSELQSRGQLVCRLLLE